MIGETLGQKYRLLRLLGRGGMGSVYEAEQAETSARVAVKVLHSHLLLPGGEGPRRFRREASAVLGIRSEHIVRVLDAGADEATGHLYIVTEHLDGEDLQSLLDRIGPLAQEGVLAIAAQALAGLCDAHAAGVVHRDIKPANVFLARRPGGALAVKLLDFGIAKVRADPLSPAMTTDLTTTGSFLGSPLYMSPEQVQNSRDVDHRTDLWSLGCALYAALAGRAPHQHLSSLGQLLVAICVSPPPPLLDVAPWVSPAVAGVVHGALALAPDARYPTAEAMLEAVRRLAPPADFVEEMLVSSGRRASGEGGHRPSASSLPPSPQRSTPRVVVALGGPVRGDASTEHAHFTAPVRGDASTEHAPPARLTSAPGAATLGSAPDTLGSAPDLPPRARSGGFPPSSPPPPGVHVPPEDGAREVARSGVPAVGARVGARHVTVDARRFLGEKTELWTFSLDVHRHLGSLISRIWKAMRRAGAKVPPMTYGAEWVLYEPRTGRAIAAERAEGADPPGLDEVGIRPGTILWVLRPGAIPPPVAPPRTAETG